MAGLIFETSGNSIWTFQNVDYPINSISSYSDSIVFAVGDSGYIVTNKDLQTNISKYYLNENKIHVFPNPSQNEIVIVYESEFIVGKEIEILNNLGQVVFHQKYSISEKMIVNIVEFPIGIYFIKVSDESGIIGIKKVTKT
ncbi:MAG TPA: T9SS type A sorting domain-containing protein [Bacteroidia bacterium]|nr:T9SS type A sorting domain-containing protein [Bacteroidia bacterium]